MVPAAQDYSEEDRGICKIPELVAVATAAAMTTIIFTLIIISLLATYRMLS